MGFSSEWPGAEAAPSLVSFAVKTIICHCHKSVKVCFHKNPQISGQELLDSRQADEIGVLYPETYVMEFKSFFAEVLSCTSGVFHAVPRWRLLMYLP